MDDNRSRKDTSYSYGYLAHDREESNLENLARLGKTFRYQRLMLAGVSTLPSISEPGKDVGGGECHVLYPHQHHLQKNLMIAAMRPSLE